MPGKISATLFAFCLLTGSLRASSEADVSLVMEKNTFNSGEPISVSIQNHRDSPVWYCLEVSELTVLYCGPDGTPVPAFTVLGKQRDEDDWGFYLWGTGGYGNFYVAEELTPLSSQKYLIKIGVPGLYRLQLPFCCEALTNEMCDEKIENMEYASSIVFTVVE
jgi:hypothetical protein